MKTPDISLRPPVRTRIHIHVTPCTHTRGKKRITDSHWLPSDPYVCTVASMCSPSQNTHIPKKIFKNCKEVKCIRLTQNTVHNTTPWYLYKRNTYYHKKDLNTNLTTALFEKLKFAWLRYHPQMNTETNCDKAIHKVQLPGDKTEYWADASQDNCAEWKRPAPHPLPSNVDFKTTLL